jgi:hypothetical protein
VAIAAAFALGLPQLIVPETVNTVTVPDNPAASG